MKLNPRFVALVMLGVIAILTFVLVGMPDAALTTLAVLAVYVVLAVLIS